MTNNANKRLKNLRKKYECFLCSGYLFLIFAYFAAFEYYIGSRFKKDPLFFVIFSVLAVVCFLTALYYESKRVQLLKQYHAHLCRILYYKENILKEKGEN